MEVGGFFFSKLNDLFWGYFDLRNAILSALANNFRGDPSVVSAQTKALMETTHHIWSYIDPKATYTL